MKRTAATASKIKSGPIPPEIRVKTISNTGKVTLTFTNKMNFPPELLEVILNPNKEVESP